MILNNWKKILLGYRKWSGTYTTNIPAFTALDGQSYSYISNGQQYSSTYGISYKGYIRNMGDAFSEYMKPQIANSTKYSVRLGTGDTPVTADDYTLDNDITSSFTNIGKTMNIHEDTNNNIVTTITITGTNNSGSTQIIKEVGITFTACVASSDSAIQNHFDVNALICREVLSEPLEVANGQGFRIVVDMIENIT